MKLGYDIFQKLDDGCPLWIANVQTRAQAPQKVTSLRRSAAARYFVRDAERCGDQRRAGHYQEP